MSEYKPCGGCGAKTPNDRCINCFHDFGGIDGKLSAPMTPDNQPQGAGEVRKCPICNASDIGINTRDDSFLCGTVFRDGEKVFQGTHCKRREPEALREQLDALKAECAKLRRRAATWKQEAKELRSANWLVDDVTSIERDQFKAECQKLQRSLETEEKRHKLFAKAAFDERDTARARIGELEGELQKQLANYEVYRDANERQAVDIKHLRAQLVTIKAQLAQAQADTGRLATAAKRFLDAVSGTHDYEGTGTDVLMDELEAALPAPASGGVYTEDELKKWWPAECPKCGWKGLSRDAEGGGSLGDSGDYDAVVCPECIKHEKWVPVDAVDAPAPQIDPGEGWRLLRDEEMIQRGDEMYATIDDLWLPSVAAGAYPQPGMAYRRRKAPSDAQREEGGVKYRLLTKADAIAVGDEVLSDDCETWEQINRGPSVGESWMIGANYSPNVFNPMRREVEPAPTTEARGCPPPPTNTAP